MIYELKLQNISINMISSETYPDFELWLTS